MLQVKQVELAYESQQVLQQVHFSVCRGETFGIIGPNGSGKSSLLKLISGIEMPQRGEVTVDRKPVWQYSAKELSKMLAVLQQEALPSIGFSVRDVVEMGRFPYQSWLGTEKTDTQYLIDDIMQRLGIDHFSTRNLAQLSGGERQRVALGKAMAQQPRLLLLDEPTTYLDIGYQVQMMDYIAEWKQADDLTVIAVLHDLNLAAQYCDRLLVLDEGRVIRIGVPEEIIQEVVIEQVYDIKPVVLNHPTMNVPQILLQRSRVSDRGRKRAGIMHGS